MSDVNVCRWGDNDRYFGPFTFALDRTYRSLAIMISSGDDEGSLASLRVSAFGATVIMALPRWLVPTERKKVLATLWDAATIKRLGRNWYWDETRRRYGISVFEGHLSLHYGREANDSRTEQRKGWLLPWTQWRFNRWSLYGLDGRLFAHLPANYRFGTPEDNERQRLTEACPVAVFAFNDFDGEALVATTKIEEREWLFGRGWFRWLSLFRAPKVRRSLDIHFSGETGRRKGSWKGGTIGCGIDMLPGELHAAAFERYCAKHDMRFEREANK
jgi:hypothetical protein